MSNTRMRGACITALVVCVLAACAIFYVWRATHVIILNRDDLQRAVEKKFPIEKRDILYSASLSDPKVGLTDGSDRIGISLHVSAAALGSKPVSGDVAIDGGVQYDPAAGELYLTDPTVKSLDIAGLDGHTAEIAHDVINALLAARFNRVLIYRLSPNRANEQRAHEAVKSVAVKGGRVVIELK